MTLSTARRAASLLLLGLAACGTDTGVAGTETTSQTTGAPETATSAMSTASSGVGEGVTTTGGGVTGDALTSSGAPDDATSTGAGGEVTTTQESATTGGPSTTGETSTSADEEIPPPLCPDQDKAPPNVGERKAINDDPRFIQVYVNNIENLKLAGEQCPGDWTDLIYYMKTIKPSPDLFLVQQISDKAQLDTLVERMNDELPGIWEGVIADADPWTQLSPCGKEKEKQTNAIVLRQGRFSKVGEKHVWQSWANKNGECVRNNQARTRNVMIKLHDKIADKDITVASMHWSTSQGDGPDPACAKENVLEVDQKLHKSGYGGELVIFAGDFNEPDRKDNGDPRPWYAQANGDGGGKLNYRDPIYRACQSAAKLQTCLDDNWTIGSDRRIDMIFAQDGAGCRARTARAHTITYNEADAAVEEITGVPDEALNYSEHRGVRAEIYY